jgi:hypothetical protein
MFLLSPCEEERIVCSNKTLFIGTEDDCVLDFDAKIVLDKDLNFPKPKRIDGLFTVEDVANHVKFNTHFTCLQGLVMFRQHDKLLESVKILSTEYDVRFSIRANVPSLKFRYLEIRRNCPEHLDLFFELYPNQPRDVEEKIYNLCNHLHGLYLQKYVEKYIRTEYTQKEKYALKIIHDKFLESRQRTTKSRINDILTACNTSVLHGLLREFEFGLY